MAGKDPQQLRWQLIQAEEKRTREIIERDFGCGRMNTTKWREAIGAIREVEVKCRIKLYASPLIRACQLLRHEYEYA